MELSGGGGGRTSMDAKKRAGAIMDMVRWISVVEVSSKISC